MSSSRQRQLLLTLIAVVTVGATVLVAGAGGRATGPAPEAWAGTWAMAPTAAGKGKSGEGFVDQTVRMVVKTTAAGDKARITLSNRFGTQQLVVGHATIALPWVDGGPGDLQPGSLTDLTFHGQKDVTIPPGGATVSDPVEFDVPASGEVVVSVYLPEETGPATWHVFARQTSYIGEGDHTADASGAQLPETRNNWYYLTGIDVLNTSGEGTVAVIGDSITDGFKATVNANTRWTDYLAERLNREAPGEAPGVLNLGLSGNRYSADGSGIGFPELGVNPAARFHEDVFAHAGVDTVVLELGINDVWITKLDANAIIEYMQQIAALAHQAGLKVYVCTLSPWNAFESGGVVQYTPAKDSVRLAVNSYVRSTTDFDGVIDFDKILRDPADSSRLRAEWDSGDHIHPNDEGNKAMAEAFPIELILND